MGDTVTMTHPDIDGEIHVHPRGVRVREKAGWQVKAAAAKKAPAKKPAPKSEPVQGDQTATSGTDAAQAASNQED